MAASGRHHRLMAQLKQKGDIAELAVALDLRRRGYRILLPFGEDNDYDLAVDRGDRLERVQVKHVRSDGRSFQARCYSVTITAGKPVAVKRYTAATIDWLAVYDATTQRCFYIPAAELGEGRKSITLRLEPCSYNRLSDVRFASDYETMEPAGLEPATSSVQGKRSPN